MIFFMVYKLVMGIAVLRVIYGVFLHVTFGAEDDDETQVAKKAREEQSMRKKLEAIFNLKDKQEMGRREFLSIISNDRCKALLSAMQLEVDNAEVIFALADDGDNRIGLDELTDSFARLK